MPVITVHVHVACGHWQSTLYVVPSLHISLWENSQGGGPPSVGPPLLLPPPIPTQEMGAGESMKGVASMGSPPELLEDTPPEPPPDEPPELLLDPGPPSPPSPPVFPPHAKPSAGTHKRPASPTAKLR